MSIGLIAQLKGRPSHDLVQRALLMSIGLEHRGGTASEPNTGDGAGITIQMPDRFLSGAVVFPLPSLGGYGAGLVFLPHAEQDRDRIKRLLHDIAAEEGQHLIGWRSVPTDLSLVGPTALAVAPVVEHVFIAAGFRVDDDAAHRAFERKLFVIRKRAERAVSALQMNALSRQTFHVVSLSASTLTYKGLLTSDQLRNVFPDLSDPAFESAVAIVHRRFGTHPYPSWALAQPFRLVAHTGVSDTTPVNAQWMRARVGVLHGGALGEDLRKVVLSLARRDGGAGAFDDVLEFLVMSGRTLVGALAMMTSEPWRDDESMAAERKAFREYQAALMPPWEHAGAVAFTDGRVIGAIGDRHGLYPLRYLVTKDDFVVAASEVGLLDLPSQDVLVCERVVPGRMLLVDTVAGRIVADEEIISTLAAEYPYRDWLDRYAFDVDDLPDGAALPPEHSTLFSRQLAFGYTEEELRLSIGPMATEREEPVGSMGGDTALAALSDRPRLLYDYFTQQFAQAASGPVDWLREEHLTELHAAVGTQGNLLAPGGEACRHVRLRFPVVHNRTVAKLRDAPPNSPLRATTLPILFDPEQGGAGLERAMNELCRRSSDAVAAGFTILILSDRGVGNDSAPIPSLLAVAGVQHHLVREGTRPLCALVIESGDARDVHHVSLLLGYGANVVNPYVALETIGDLIAYGALTGIERDRAVQNYLTALNKGVLTVMAKAGISLLANYCGSQPFEAVGLSQGFVDAFFTGTTSRIGGVGIDVVGEEARLRHDRAFGSQPPLPRELESGGEHQWRRDGELHLFNPETVFKLQHATRSAQYGIFKQYTVDVDRQHARRATLRGLLRFKPARGPVLLDEVEPATELFKRFATGAMSYGSISREAHETLAIAMNRLGGRSNSGEGGEDPERHSSMANGDSKRSAIKQVASGRFGVTSEYLVNADELQIRLSQGALPGEGGRLPGNKAYPWIAATRRTTPGVTLISPARHHDASAIEDVAQLVYDLKCANPQARISVKIAAQAGIGGIVSSLAKAHADAVLISGHDGGTGASSFTSRQHAGVPWELGLAESQQSLVLSRLRDRVTLQVDGQIKTGRDVVVAALLGAEEFGFATAPLVVMGCTMMRVCHLNTCPVGIATQDPDLRRKFTGTPQLVETFFHFIAAEVREYMAQLGFRTFDEMIGRTDCLAVEPAMEHWKARGLDVTALLHQLDLPPSVARRKVREQDHGLEDALDNTLIAQCRPALEQSTPVELFVPITVADRAVGTMLGCEVTRRYGEAGLPDDTIRLRFKGSAGRSFGAFVPRGLSMTLVGDANDGFGKGLSGGRLVLYPPRESTFKAEENVIVGHAAFYGATSGEGFVRGVAGDRFCVRNSGATVCVEGIGDHGCESMTGGRVIVLGRTGQNFAAGMSGGIAYVLDADGRFSRRCNRELVDLEALVHAGEIDWLQTVIMRHAAATGSAYANSLLSEWASLHARLVKVMPRDYKRALADQTLRAAAGSDQSAVTVVAEAATSPGRTHGHG